MDSDDSTDRCDRPRAQLAAAVSVAALMESDPPLLPFNQQPLNHLDWVQLRAIRRIDGRTNHPAVEQSEETLSPG